MMKLEGRLVVSINRKQRNIRIRNCGNEMEVVGERGRIEEDGKAIEYTSYVWLYRCSIAISTINFY